MMSHPVVLWQVRKNWFRGNQSISLSQDSHHHLTARHLWKAELSGSNRLFLRHAPAQLNLLHVQIMCRGTTPQLWEHDLNQDVTLSVHVSEGGGNKHTYTLPPENRGGGKGCKNAEELDECHFYVNNVIFTSIVALLVFVQLDSRSQWPWRPLVEGFCTACLYSPHGQAAGGILVLPQTWWNKKQNTKS